MKALFPEPANNRPVQPLNDRTVLGDYEEINNDEFPEAHLPGVPMHWTYGETKRWKKGYEECAGMAQSPINIKMAAGIPADDATIFFQDQLSVAPRIWPQTSKQWTCCASGWGFWNFHSS